VGWAHLTKALDTGAVLPEEPSMNFVDEAKKFIQRAADARHPEVVKEQLKMADWCLDQAIEERDGSRAPAAPPPEAKAARPS
jgi:hypothetical protein